jgi:hypothetical protein
MTRLKTVEAWGPTDAEEFGRFVGGLTNERDQWALFKAMDEDVLKGVAHADQDLFPIAADFFCRTSLRPHIFEYCDVVIGRLETIFELGDLSTSSAAAVAAAELGASHNRFYVMGRVMRMCGPAMDATLAERIAIEIAAEEAESAFAKCADVIGRSIEEYHPRIANAIRPALEATPARP